MVKSIELVFAVRGIRGFPCNKSERASNEREIVHLMMGEAYQVNAQRLCSDIIQQIVGEGKKSAVIFFSYRSERQKNRILRKT